MRAKRNRRTWQAVLFSATLTGCCGTCGIDPSFVDVYECEPTWTGAMGGTFHRGPAGCDKEGKTEEGTGVVPMVGEFKCEQGSYELRVDLPSATGTSWTQNPDVILTFKPKGEEESCGFELQKTGTMRSYVSELTDTTESSDTEGVTDVKREGDAEASLAVEATILSASDACSDAVGKTIIVSMQASCKIKVDKDKTGCY